MRARLWSALHLHWKSLHPMEWCGGQMTTRKALHSGHHRWKTIAVWTAAWPLSLWDGNVWERAFSRVCLTESRAFSWVLLVVSHRQLLSEIKGCPSLLWPFALWTEVMVTPGLMRRNVVTMWIYCIGWEFMTCVNQSSESFYWNWNRKINIQWYFDFAVLFSH